MTDQNTGAWLLDTSILVSVLRADTLGRYLVEDLQLRARQEVPLFSVVCVGEMLSLAKQFDWGEQRLAHMREILAELVIVDINSEPVLSAYAEIDTWCRQNGVSPGKNDLWVAATAVATESTLLTSDKDFDPLHQIFLKRLYFDPHGTYLPSAGTAE